MKITWSPLALDRVDKVAEYIARDNYKAALEWINTVFNKVDKLAKYPLRGRIVPEINRPDIREIFYWNYRIIYRYSQSHLFVLTVRHQRQLIIFNEILKK